MLTELPYLLLGRLFFVPMKRSKSTLETQTTSQQLQTPSQPCPETLTPLLLRHESENCWDLTQRPHSAEAQFLVSQQARAVNKKGRGCPGRRACGLFQKVRRTTTAEEQKHQSSSQVRCTGKTNYFTCIKQQILRQWFSSPNQERSEICGGR